MTELVYGVFGLFIWATFWATFLATCTIWVTIREPFWGNVKIVFQTVCQKFVLHWFFCQIVKTEITLPRNELLCQLFSTHGS